MRVPPGLTPLLVWITTSSILISCGDSGSLPNVAGPPAKLQIASGDQQPGVVGKELGSPLVAKVVDSNGDPVQGQLVNFRVTSGGGSVFAGAGISGSDGVVRERWTLGTSTADSQQVEARAVDNQTGAAIVFAVFRATPKADLPDSIVNVSGDGQPGSVNTALPNPLTVRVQDQYGNPVAGDTVTWTAGTGSGGTTPASDTTDQHGKTSTMWTLGPTVGLQTVAAGSHGLVATFTATTQPPSVPSQALALSGGGQSSPGDGFLPESLVVRVIDQFGINVAGVQVSWAAASAEDSASPSVSSTNALGRAATAWWVGPTGGSHSMTATVTGLPPVVFTATVHQALTFAAISSGGATLDEHTCALTTSGAAYCWGAGSYGRLGNGSTSSSSVPVPVSGNLQFASISAGGYHTCALTNAGQAYCWGRNASGQLGNGTTADASTPQAIPSIIFSAIDAGAFHTCGVTPAGSAYCWGSNAHGELGDGTITTRSTPILFSGGLQFASISAGGNTQASHTCGIVTGGAGYCWGSDGFEQLGTATAGDQNTPTLVTTAAGFTGLDAGGYHTCSKTTSGSMLCWGYNAYGQLTNTVTGALFGIAVGGWTSCATLANGDGYCWGWGRYGNRGDGVDTEGSPTPTLQILGGLAFAQISPGAYHACGVTTSGDAYCWGYGSDGQLGNGSNVFQLAPAKVASP